MPRIPVLALIVMVVGCPLRPSSSTDAGSDPGPADAGTEDSGSSGASDGSVGDGAARDGSAPDAAAADASGHDAGMEDGGHTDAAAPPDSGTQDAGPADAGPGDGSGRDGGGGGGTDAASAGGGDGGGDGDAGADGGMIMWSCPIPGCCEPIQDAGPDVRGQFEYPFIDVHTHGYTFASCDAGPCFATADWEQARNTFGGCGAVVASLQHFSTLVALGDLDGGAEAEFVSTQNVRARATAASHSGVGYFASLECWADQQFDDPQWPTRCLDDADYWLAQGALGFKDHAGKTTAGGYTGAPQDRNRWVGTFNRLNGYCAGDVGDAGPNLNCLGESGVRFPMLEPAWREVVRGLVEERGVPVLTHMGDWVVDATCWDPLTSTVRPCRDATAAHALDFAAWAEANLSAQARRRIIFAHVGGLDPSRDTTQWADQILSYGLSFDLASRTDLLLQDVCQARAFIAGHPEQFLLGTDNWVEGPEPTCTPSRYRVWEYLLEGPRTLTLMNLCGSTISVRGMDLDSATTSGCTATVGPDVLPNVLRNNFLRMYQRP